MIITGALILLLAAAIFFYLRQPEFGKMPSGERLARIERSPHYKNGRFHNLVEEPTLSEGYSTSGEVYSTFFKEHPRRSPIDSLPSIRTDLSQLPADSNVAVWFGHSSVFIQVDGKNILVDPSFSGRASPLPGSVKAYRGSNIYSAADMPPIDYLLIEHWGYAPEQIIEKDWDEAIEVDSGFTIYTESSHHESGRGFVRDKTLWMSYLIQAPGLSIYVSGDGGYDGRFAETEKKFGPVDWAIMDDGQYDKAWESVHLLPEEVRQATLDLKARHLLPVHHSKYTLGKHAWDEPLIRTSELAVSQPYRVATPMIGEVLYLDNPSQPFREWWKGVR